jgi:hypothetical protein
MIPAIRPASFVNAKLYETNECRKALAFHFTAGFAGMFLSGSASIAVAAAVTKHGKYHYFASWRSRRELNADTRIRNPQPHFRECDRNGQNAA